jgi:hypothetical protein
MASNLDKNLTDILNSFSDKEWKEFEKFCASPFHNGGRNYAAILKLLRKFRPGFDSPDLNKEFLYKKLHPERQFRASAINSTLSRLNLMAESFLVQCGLSEDRYMMKERFLLSQIGSRGLRKRSERLVSTVETKMESMKAEPFDFTARKEMYAEISTFYSVNNMRHKHLHYVGKCVQYVIYSFLSELSYFQAAEISGYGYTATSKLNSISIQILRELPIEKIMSLIEKADNKNYVFLKMYYLLLKAFENPEVPENYFSYKRSVYELMNDMSDTMKRFVLNTLSVLSNVFMVTGNSEFKKESFEIRKKTVDENLFAFSHSGYPKISEFRSTFIDALNQNETAWAEEFCEKFISKLQPDLRGEIRDYYKSRLCYEHREYDEALRLAARVNINQLIFKLDMKNLLAKIYYDTGSIESLLSLIDTYNKLTGSNSGRVTTIQLRHRKFTANLKKLLHLKTKNADRLKMELFRRRLINENFTSKRWLMEKLDELIQEHTL